MEIFVGGNLVNQVPVQEGILSQAVFAEHDVFESPVGNIRVISHNDRLCQVELGSEAEIVSAQPQSAFSREVRRQFEAYFSGRLQEFDLPLLLHGTPFQVRVWKSLRQIPKGQTWSYADLAQHVGQPQAFRAVGTANGKNPLPIVVPCHRVIAKDGTLGGFSGGLWRKRVLLRLEGIHIPA